MDLNHDTLVLFSKTWGLFYLIAMFLGVIVYVLLPSNRSRFQRAKESVLDEDESPWQ